MTLDECHSSLIGIRRKQGTRHPRVRVDCGGQVFRGRLARADSDPEHRGLAPRDRGSLVLEDLALGRSATTVVPIERIPSGGIQILE